MTNGLFWGCYGHFKMSHLLKVPWKITCVGGDMITKYNLQRGSVNKSCVTSGHDCRIHSIETIALGKGYYYYYYNNK